MDYHHPYNVYPEYYCPPYGTAGPGYHSNGTFPHQSHSSEHIRNFNNNIVNHSTPHHQSQQHPHHFLPSYHHPPQHPSYSSSSSMFVPNFLVSSGTGLTPTLTPTTLANLENSFIELQQQSSGVRDPVTQSGFVPPVVEPANSADHSQDSYEQSSSDAEWEPQSKMPRFSAGIKGIDYIVTSTGTINATPQRKYTRRNKDEKLAPEEEEKRRVRRERNKQAAAKCRQRRVDHTNELLEETEQLESEQSKLESEIQKLQQERDQLEFVLQAHQPVCKVNKVKVKLEDNYSRGSNNCASPHHDHSSAACPAPENLSKTTITSGSPGNSTSSMASSSLSMATSRPNSLPLIKRDRARMLSMSSATGVTINTPTSGVTITPSSLFCPGLDSMVDGSTGLTPLTNLSCSSQVNHRSSGDSSNENVGSPTLISL